MGIKRETPHASLLLLFAMWLFCNEGNRKCRKSQLDGMGAFSDGSHARASATRLTSSVSVSIVRCAFDTERPLDRLQGSNTELERATHGAN